MAHWKVHTFPCEGGWYWEAFRDGVKINGGIAPDEVDAKYLGNRQARLGRQADEGQQQLEELLSRFS